MLEPTQLIPYLTPRLIYGTGVIINTPAIYEQVEELVSEAVYQDVQVETQPAVFETQVLIDTPAVLAEAGQILIPEVLDELGEIVTPAVLAEGSEELFPATTHEELVEVTPALFEIQQQLVQPAVYRTVKGDLITPAEFGVLIPHAVAQMTGFQPDQNWTEKPEGYFSTHLRLVVLQRSPVEIYSVTLEGKRFLCPAVDGNKMISDYMKIADENPDSFDIYSRVLVFFVSDTNELLHDLPIRFNLEKGIGGNFAYDLKNYYFYCCRLLATALGKPLQWLNNEALAHLVFECDLALDGEGYINPDTIYPPSLDAICLPLDEGNFISEWFNLSASFPSQVDANETQGENEVLLSYYGVKEL